MANEYHEVIIFVGTNERLRKLEEVLELQNDCGLLTMRSKAGRNYYGSVHEIHRFPCELGIILSMRNTMLGGWFPEISSDAPGLFMTSSSHCIYENRYYLIGGFNGSVDFLARPPMFGPNYEEIPGISTDDSFLLDIVWGGFESATRAAKRSVSRRAKNPRKAVQILKQTRSAYLAAGPPPDEVFG